MVTTNAESGPGSLRAAIETANSNGTAVHDIIRFNIPATAFLDRVILLTSELPALTSNLTIDGSTQPGESFQNTDAKILIKQDQYAPSFASLRISNAKNVNIYGLYLYIGYWEGIFWPLGNRSPNLYGIDIIDSRDIEIGAPGKGNVINGSVYAIHSVSASCRNIRIRSNFLGIGSYFLNGNNPNSGTDVDDVVLGCEYAVYFINVKDITFGGENVADGNVVSCYGGLFINSQHRTGNGFIQIRNNLFGKWYDKVSDIGNFGSSFTTKIKIGNNDQIDYKLSFLDNYLYGALGIHQLTEKFSIQRNHFNLPDFARSNDGKLAISYCSAGGLIGGDNLTDRNIFTGKYEFGVYAINEFQNGPVEIFKNKFDCNYSYGSVTSIYPHPTYDGTPIPMTQVDKTTATSVSGRATPNSRVDLYYDDKCNACEGEIFIATVTADANGKWQYSGNITDTVIAMATKNGYSGSFSEPRFDVSKMVVVPPTCGKTNASITGITGDGAGSHFWINLQTKDTVGRTLDLVNVPAGEYVLYGRHGNCISSIGQSIRFEDVTPKINNNNTSIGQPACGKFNGYILNVHYLSSPKFVAKWLNANNQIVGYGNGIKNMPPGNYTFVLIDTTINGGCSDTARYELINQSGPELNLQSLHIKPATCSNADGSITNITSVNTTGFENIQWLDSLDNVVGTDFDLLNVPGGRYRLKYKDQSACDPIITPYFEVPSPALNFVKPVIVKSDDGYCGNSTGFIIVESFDRDISGYTFKWKDKNSGATVGNGSSISRLNNGEYVLVAEDVNGCSKDIFEKKILANPVPVFDYSQLKVTDESCSLLNGAIENVKLSGTFGSVQYTWVDASGDIVSSSVNLSDVEAGQYHVKIIDEKSCEVTSGAIHVKNISIALPLPEYDGVVIAKNTSSTFSCKNPSPGSYLLYSDAAAQQLTGESSEGVFETPALTADVTYYVKNDLGACSSAVKQVNIKVVDKSFFVIPNAFTPNSDGLNDDVVVKVHGYINLNYFKIFNRYGQEVFVSSRLNDKWDGRVNGKPASTGTYVWTGRGTDLLGQPVTGNGTITLIR